MTEETDRKRRAGRLAIPVIALLTAATFLAVQDDGTAAAEEEFNEGVIRYMEVHRTVAGAIPDIGGEASPEKVVSIRRQMAGGIREAIPDADSGHIFTDRVGDHFRNLIAQAFHSPAGTTSAARETALGDGNPESEEDAEATPVVLRVLGDYPVEAPLSTVPPALLQRLPDLPDELEYRFVGPDLILRDTKANIIVDFLRNVAGPE